MEIMCASLQESLEWLSAIQKHIAFATFSDSVDEISARANKLSKNSASHHMSTWSMYNQFLKGAEDVIMAGAVHKKNRYGNSKKYDLVLTKATGSLLSSTFRMFYIDVDALEVKGELNFKLDNEFQNHSKTIAKKLVCAALFD